MRYRAAFLWGLLCEWHRALSDPVDSLVAERRVSVCLPDIETCYMPVSSLC